MKILYYIDHHDSRVESIVACLKLAGCNAGYLTQMDTKSIYEFNPDVVIHNIPDVEQFPVQGKCISVGFNDTEGVNCFTFTNENSSGYIAPFVSLKSIDVKDDEIDKYSSDVVYFGSPLTFETATSIIYEKKLRFRFFSANAHNIYGYAGACNSNEYFKHYRHAKASIVNGFDIARLQDIVVSGGNPVVFSGDVTDFSNKISDAVYNNKKYDAEGITKKDILDNKTSFDASSRLFKQLGLNKISKDIMTVKQTVVGKYI